MAKDKKASQKIVQEMVAVKLTEAEIGVKARELTDALNALDVLDEKHKGDKKKMKLEMDNALEKEKALREVVASGEEQRPTDCYEDLDVKKGIVTTRRCDNDKAVSTRKATDEDRQGELVGREGHLANPPPPLPDSRA